MTEETIVKAPDQAVVAKATEKVASGVELNQREEKALADQRAVDQARGYEQIDFRGVTMYRALRTQHTEQTEEAIQRYVANLHPPGTIPTFG